MAVTVVWAVTAAFICRVPSWSLANWFGSRQRGLCRPGLCRGPFAECGTRLSLYQVQMWLCRVPVALGKGLGYSSVLYLSFMPNMTLLSIYNSSCVNKWRGERLFYPLVWYKLCVYPSTGRAVTELGMQSWGTIVDAPLGSVSGLVTAELRTSAWGETRV
jgi:hypothetical protein